MNHRDSVWDSLAQLVLAVGGIGVAFLCVMAVYLMVEAVAEWIGRRVA